MTWAYDVDLRPEEIEAIERQDEAEIRDRVARNTARREQSRTQSSTDEL